MANEVIHLNYAELRSEPSSDVTHSEFAIDLCQSVPEFASSLRSRVPGEARSDLGKRPRIWLLSPEQFGEVVGLPSTDQMYRLRAGACLVEQNPRGIASYYAPYNRYHAVRQHIGAVHAGYLLTTDLLVAASILDTPVNKVSSIPDQLRPPLGLPERKEVPVIDADTLSALKLQQRQLLQGRSRHQLSTTHRLQVKELDTQISRIETPKLSKKRLNLSHYS